MSYIIDFRVRPPYKSFLGSGIFRCWDFQSPETMTAIQMGRNPIPSVREGSMDMFVKEMDEAGIVESVIMGRRTGDAALGSGAVDNCEIKELMDRYPGRFIGFAGIDPTEEGAWNPPGLPRTCMPMIRVSTLCMSGVTPLAWC